MLLIAFMRCRKTGRGYFTVFFRGGVGMSLDYAFMRSVYTELLQKTGTSFHVLARCRESCKKEMCSISWQKAQVWEKLQILMKAAHRQNRLCLSFLTTQLDSTGLRISSVYALSQPHLAWRLMDVRREEGCLLLASSPAVYLQSQRPISHLELSQSWVSILDSQYVIIGRVILPSQISTSGLWHSKWK